MRAPGAPSKAPPQAAPPAAGRSTGGKPLPGSSPPAAAPGPEPLPGSSPPAAAVDGASASGKGTLARALAEALGFAHLDTGALYRAAALRLLESGGDPGDPEAAAAAAAATRAEDANLGAPLRSEAAAAAASRLAALPGARAALLPAQRAFARRPPGGAAGAVLDGRDVGTVVLPGAACKIFLAAEPEERARRRLEELRRAGGRPTLAEVRGAMARRDALDAGREAAPLRRAPDALLLDTTGLSPGEALGRALAFARSRL